MASPDLEGQKTTPQLDSPHDSDTDSNTPTKPSPQNGYSIPTWRKCLILFIVSWMTLAVTFSSTSLLPATPEIATEFSTSTEILNVINAGVLIAMGFSSFIWGPITNVFGRRAAYNAAIVVLCGCSAGTAASIDLHMFIAMRLLSGFTGTFFMVAGQTIIADIYEPVCLFRISLAFTRLIFGLGRAGYCSWIHDGWFGQWTGYWYVSICFNVHGGLTVSGPCIGGIIVTFSQWRIIYWLQFGMTALGLVLSLLFVPTINNEREMKTATRARTVRSVLSMFNPLRIFRPFIYPNVFLCVRPTPRD
jgi:MFS family permease